eukprot:6417604-Amphidinium_carterae.1
MNHDCSSTPRQHQHHTWLIPDKSRRDASQATVSRPRKIAPYMGTKPAVFVKYHRSNRTTKQIAKPFQTTYLTAPNIHPNNKS